MTKGARSSLINAMIIVVTLGLVIYLGAKDGGLGNAWHTMRTADWKWILMAIGAWCVFISFEALGIHVFFRRQKVKIHYFSSLIVTLIGSFYSSVTPAATGGQPMQVLALKRRGIPAGISTSNLAVKFFTFQTALLSLGGLMWILNPGVVQDCIARVGIWFVIAGFLLNGLTVVAVLMLAISKNLVRAILTLAIRIGKALHLVKDVADTASKADAAIEDFHASVDMLTHHPLQLFQLYLLSCVQVLGLMSIVYCVYRALGLSSRSYFDILTLQLLLYIGASFTPLPGASGAQEGGFLLIFGNVFPDAKMFGAQLLWRFFTYYFTLIIGITAIIIDSAGNIRRVKKRQAEERAAAQVPPVDPPTDADQHTEA